MMILHHVRALLLTPPKTASAAINRTLERLPGCELLMGDTEGRRDQHNTVAPPFMEDWNRFVVVRHPLDRLVSMWHHLVSWNAQHGDGCCSFKRYVEMISEEQSCRSLHWMYKWSISHWLAEGHVRPGELIRFENLLHDLRSKAQVSIDHLVKDNATARRSAWPLYYDNESLSIACKLFREDFEQFKYPFPKGY